MKVILFTTLLLFSINGFAFNWNKISTSIEGNSYYVDVSNIKKHNGLVYYWGLDDFVEPNHGANSSISKYKVDCGEGKRTWLNVTFYSQSMGKGKMIQDESLDDVDYPKPKSVGNTLMKFVCNNAR